MIEVHIDEIPEHRELEKYQELLSRKQEATHLFESREYAELTKFLKGKYTVAKKISAHMESAGIITRLHENCANCSLKNPNQPVFFEPVINLSQVDLLYKHIENSKLDNSEKTKVKKWLDRFCMLRQQVPK